MSAAPLNASAINDTVKLREIPNTIVQIPNAVTHHSIVTPTRFRSGQYANRMAIAPAPTPGALRAERAGSGRGRDGHPVGILAATQTRRCNDAVVRDGIRNLHNCVWDFAELDRV